MGTAARGLEIPHDPHQSQGGSAGSTPRRDQARSEGLSLYLLLARPPPGRLPVGVAGRTCHGNLSSPHWDLNLLLTAVSTSA